MLKEKKQKRETANKQISILEFSEGRIPLILCCFSGFPDLCCMWFIKRGWILAQERQMLKNFMWPLQLWWFPLPIGLSCLKSYLQDVWSELLRWPTRVTATWVSIKAPRYGLEPWRKVPGLTIKAPVDTLMIGIGHHSTMEVGNDSRKEVYFHFHVCWKSFRVSFDFERSFSASLETSSVDFAGESAFMFDFLHALKCKISSWFRVLGNSEGVFVHQETNGEARWTPQWFRCQGRHFRNCFISFQEIIGQHTALFIWFKSGWIENYRFKNHLNWLVRTR